MLNLYRMATSTGTRPSRLITLPAECGDWEAYQFDNAVLNMGRILENAAQEKVKAGSEDNPRWENKYAMSQLLDSDFRLPIEDEATFDVSQFAGMADVIVDEVS